MYKCSVCNKEIIVIGVSTPIRNCNCTQEIEFGGEKKTKPSSIVMDMGTIEIKGRSQFKQK